MFFSGRFVSEAEREVQQFSINLVGAGVILFVFPPGVKLLSDLIFGERVHCRCFLLVFCGGVVLLAFVYSYMLLLSGANKSALRVFLGGAFLGASALAMSFFRTIVVFVVFVCVLFWGCRHHGLMVFSHCCTCM